MNYKVLLIAPYSNTRVGGIGTQIKNILDYRTKNSKSGIEFLNTFFKFKPNLVKSKAKRLIYGVLDSLLVLLLIVINIIRFKPKTIHYTSSGSYALIKDLFAVYISKTFGIKFIIHWHFGRIPELIERKNMEGKILKCVIRAANHSIVLDYNSLICLKRIGMQNVSVIPNMVSEYLHSRAKAYNLRNKRLDFGTIVFVGHIIPEKGVFELVEACSKIKAVNRLILIGPVLKNIKLDLISMASQRDNGYWLTWTGEIQSEEVFQYLDSAGAMCLPSYTEGFPNIVLEAMAVGCPVIASRVGAIEEMISSIDFGEAGICIDPRNVDQLVSALEFIITNTERAKEYGSNGNQRVLSKYTPDKVFPQFENLWLLNS